MELFILYAPERTGSTLLTNSIKDWLWPSQNMDFSIGCVYTQLLKQILLSNEYDMNSKKWFWRFHDLGHVLQAYEYLKNIDGTLKDYKTAIDKYFTNHYSVYLTRRNKIGQAISLLKARQTKQFYFDQIPEDECFFDEEKLHDIIIELVGIEQQYECFFDRSGIKPYRLYYEDIAQDGQGIGHKLAEHFGFEQPTEPWTPYLKKQADELNAEWAERFAFAGDARAMNILTGVDID